MIQFVLLTKGLVVNASTNISFYSVRYNNCVNIGVYDQTEWII